MPGNFSDSDPNLRLQVAIRMMPCEMEAGREVAYALADALLALTTAAYRDHMF